MSSKQPSSVLLHLNKVLTYFMKRFFLIFSTFLVSIYSVHAQTGVRGQVSTEKGEPLPFATVYIRNLKTGAATNVEGNYELKLSPGKYDLVFQYIGYEAQVKFVEVSEGFEKLDISLQQQTIVLKEVEVRAGKEDPAYTIMRKAIAKAKYHTQQVDSFDVKVYVKGSGRLLDSPFFLRKRIAKEGIDSTMAFTSETFSELHFERPNTIEEKVIAVHSKGESNGTGPTEIVQESFYQPRVNDAISPLSPKAFAYYRFEYQGSFQENDYLINKIRISPRSRGDNVFDGTIFIVEDLWSIHSLDLSTNTFGLDLNINQIYAPIEDVAWLPISHKIDVIGTFFGFDFEYNYLVTLKDYQVSLNPDLQIEFEVVDEKVAPEAADKVEPIKTEAEQTLEKLASQKEVTRKDLRKLLNEYEKQELKESKQPQVVSNITYVQDSTTEYSDDSIYWEAIRPVPLTAYEKKGYITIDSLEAKEKAEIEQDSIERKTFRPWDILTGKNYNITKRSKLILRSPLGTLGYNTVEGYHFEYDLRLRLDFTDNKRFEIGPVARYSFARETLVGKLNTSYRFGERLKRGKVKFEGGRYVSQINEEEPIHPLINTFTALFLEESYIRLYEKDFLKFSYDHKLRRNLEVKSSLEMAERQGLENNTDHVWFNNEGKSFDSNIPENLELPNTRIDEHMASTLNLQVSYSPWLRYSIWNDEMSVIRKSSPTFTVSYRKGISGLLSSDINYDLLDIGVDYSFDLGIRSKVDLQVNAGKFVNQGGRFIDYKHFLGNQTPFATTDPTKSFRLLDYYLYSTNDQYLTAHLHNQFRRLLITQFPMIRLMGLKENLFVNYLATPTSDSYTEVGYGLDNIFRVFRVEAIASFQDGQYQDFGARIGIATNLDDLFN